MKVQIDQVGSYLKSLMEQFGITEVDYHGWINPDEDQRPDWNLGFYQPHPEIIYVSDNADGTVWSKNGMDLDSDDLEMIKVFYLGEISEDDITDSGLEYR